MLFPSREVGGGRGGGGASFADKSLQLERGREIYNRLCNREQDTDSGLIVGREVGRKGYSRDIIM